MWVVKLERVIDGQVVSSQDVATFDRPMRLEQIGDFGLTLDDGKPIVAAIQRAVITEQVAADAQARRICDACGGLRYVKDHRQRTIDTVFGRVRGPRPYCRRCRATNTLPRGRSTREFDELRAILAAQLPYRVARDLLKRLLPTDNGIGITTIRNQVFAVAERLDAARSPAAKDITAEELVVGLDTAHIRSSNRKQCRHHQVLVGYIERSSSHRAFACIQDDASAATLRQHLDDMGYEPHTTITAFTDGAEGLLRLPKKATGKSITPLLDWFHLAMRLQHLAQTASGFRTKTYNHERFKAKVVRAVERLRWRLWHGRRNGVRKTMNYLKRSFGNFRYRTQLDGYKHLNAGPSKFWGHLAELDRYVRTNALVIPNYHRRYHAGQRVSTAPVESTVNSLVNQRMNKRSQMRWSTDGAACVLRVRTALVNGELSKTAEEPADMPYPPSIPALPLAA